jgi:hypothetical protein
MKKILIINKHPKADSFFGIAEASHKCALSSGIEVKEIINRHRNH